MTEHRLTPALLASLAGGAWQDPATAGTPISRVIIDSREARGGELFVALRGDHTDGHSFVADALGRGALGALVSHVPDGLDPGLASRLILVDDPLRALQRAATAWRQRFTIPVIGITGSVGKTTTKEIVAQVLGTQMKVLRSIKSFNNEIGLPLTLLGLDPGHRAAVLEMGMSATGEIRHLSEMARPTHGVVTVIGESHLEFLGSREQIALAKRELIEGLPESGLAVLNADDPLVAAMADHTRARVFRFGAREGAELRLTSVASAGRAGMTFEVHWQGRRYPMTTELPGRHNLVAIGAAIAIGLDLGMALGDVATAVQQLRLDIRQRVFDTGSGVTVIDDSYNASPTSVLAALELLREFSGRKVVFLGDMLELGPAEESGHRDVGHAAARIADLVVAVGPRSRWIAEAARATDTTEVLAVETTAEAVRRAGELVRPGDVVLVKGSRGMAMEQIVEALR